MLAPCAPNRVLRPSQLTDRQRQLLMEFDKEAQHQASQKQQQGQQPQQQQQQRAQAKR